jgi:hypothetical protein
MTKMKIGSIFLAASITASAAEKLDNRGFYATRDQQAFKTEDIKKSSLGYVRGDDVQYITWDGFISGKQTYFEVHGERMRIKVGTKWTVLSFRKAPALPGGDMDFFIISEKGSDLFIKSATDGRQSLICIQSLGSDLYVSRRPYWEVYLITDPVGHPRLYRISGINADCSGIERAQDGMLLVPTWDIQKNVTPGVVINYYAIEKNGFRKTDIRFTGSIESELADEYIIDDGH